MRKDILLKIDAIKGGSIDDTYPDTIAVEGWSFGMAQPATTHSGTGGGAGRINISDLTIVKYADIGTPKLIEYCVLAKHIPEVKLIVRRGAGDEKQEFYTLTMEDVIVSGFQTSGTDTGEEIVEESVTFNFARFTVKFFAQGSDNSNAADDEFGYDIPRGVKL